MTKERKWAIEQWKTIRHSIEEVSTIDIVKPISPYMWKYNCWFCHYLRDYGADTQGCEKCPLHKWAVNKGIIKGSLEYGCTLYARTLYAIVIDTKNSLEDRLEACDLIIKALEGEHIWEETGGSV
jgi:hypothetical protein